MVRGVIFSQKLLQVNMAVDTIGIPPEHRHDLHLKWYSNNGPHLVKLASDILSFQDIEIVGLGYLVLDKMILVTNIGGP